MSDGTAPPRTGSDDENDDQDGTVSEVASFEAAEEVIFPSDATAGYPLGDDEGGAGIQEGAAGPEAPPRQDDRGGDPEDR